MNFLTVYGFNGAKQLLQIRLTINMVRIWLLLEYQALEVSRHTPLSDKMVYHFFELAKLPKDIGGSSLLLLWLALFRASAEEELRQIDALGVPELKQAISAYHSVTASTEFQELERMRAKAQHDEAQALHNERRKIAKKLLFLNLPMEHII